MTIKNALVDVAFDDLDTAIAWYGKIVGRAPDKQSIPTDAEYGFQKGGWMQVFADAERAGKSSVTLTVDDLGATQQMQYDCCHGARPIEGTGDET